MRLRAHFSFLPANLPAITLTPSDVDLIAILNLENLLALLSGQVE